MPNDEFQIYQSAQPGAHFSVTNNQHLDPKGYPVRPLGRDRINDLGPGELYYVPKNSTGKFSCAVVGQWLVQVKK